MRVTRKRKGKGKKGVLVAERKRVGYPTRLHICELLR